MKDTVGIKKIAELSGVSIGTVDRVINNRSGVSKKTAKHVNAVIKHTGYKKNNVASRLKLAKSKSISISVLFPKEAYLEDHYWHLPLLGVQKAIAELKEMGISHELFVFDISNKKSFKRASQQILKNATNAIITVPFFADECQSLREQADALNIPIVYIDTKHDVNQEQNYFIYQNSLQSGKVAGRILYQIIKDRGNYLVFNLINNNTETQKNNLERESGFKSFFEEEVPNFKPNILLITADDSKINSLEKKLLAFKKDHTPLGIFVTNSRAYLLPKILEKIGLAAQSTLIGYDLNPGNIELLRENKIQFIINQKPEFQGYSAVKGLFKFLTEQEDEELNHTIPVEVILKENL